MKDCLDMYLDELSRYPLMSCDEERAVMLRVHAGDKVARQRAIEANLRLVVSIAKQYAKAKMPLEDSIGHGNRGLCVAIDKYDPNHKSAARLSTYAVLWIRRFILDAIKANDLVRVPNYLHEIAYDKEQGKVPTCSEKCLNRLKAIQQHSHSSLEIEELPARGGEEVALDREEWLAMVNQLLSDVLDRLGERKRSVLVQLLAQDKTLREVGRQLGTSKENIRQIKERVLKELRNVASHRARAVALMEVE